VPLATRDRDCPAALWHLHQPQPQPQRRRWILRPPPNICSKRTDPPIQRATRNAGLPAARHGAGPAQFNQRETFSTMDKPQKLSPRSGCSHAAEQRAGGQLGVGDGMSVRSASLGPGRRPCAISPRRLCTQPDGDSNGQPTRTCPQATAHPRRQAGASVEVSELIPLRQRQERGGGAPWQLTACE
jgi:hypothetical protein